MRTTIIIAALLILSGCTRNKPGLETINQQELEQTINYLASQNLGGTLGGSQNYDEAVNYVEAFIRNAELKAIGDSGYYQHFTMAYNDIRTSTMEYIHTGTPKACEAGSDFLCHGFTGSNEVSGDVVFCGYGIAYDSLQYNDYAGVDLDGKIAMVFKQNPSWEIQGQKLPAAGIREKVTMAVNHGAKAVLLLSTPNAQSMRPVGSLSYGDGVTHPSIPQLHISQEVGNELTEKANMRITDLYEKIQKSKSPHSLNLQTKVKLQVEAGHKTDQKTENIIGLIEGTDPEYKDEYIILGAHLDNASRKNTSIYFPGANDNASGTAALLEIAEAFMQGKPAPKRSIIVVFFSAQNQGLNSVDHFLSHSPVPLNQVVAMLNMDCIGYGDSIHVGSSAAISQLRHIARKQDSLHTNLMVNHTWRNKGDNAGLFQKARIPALYFATPNTYKHLGLANNSPETINPSTLIATTRLGYLVAREIAAGRYEKEAYK